MDKEITLRPKFGRVIIKRELKEKTVGGIIIPDDIKKKHVPCEGIIVALGETAGWIETYIDDTLTPQKIFEVGDKVLFGRHAGAWIDATEGNDDGTLFICQDSDILATYAQGK